MVAGIQCYRKEGQGKARQFLHDYDAGKNCVGRVKELPTREDYISQGQGNGGGGVTYPFQFSQELVSEIMKCRNIKNHKSIKQQNR